MTTHALSLQIGATNTPLTSSGVYLLDYTPVSPSVNLMQTDGEVYDVERELVTETIRLHVYGASGADVQAKIGAIEQFLGLCEQRQRTRTGDRGYLHLQMSSDTESWRSEVLSGQVQIDEDGLRTWTGNGVDVTLVLTRRAYWETVAERELPLNNSSAGGKATGGVTIYNHDDATTGHDNWADIAAVDVAGNVPAPLRITLANSSGASLWTSNFYQANNVFHSPSTFTHVLEGEDAGGANDIVDGNSSGGYFGRASWTALIQHVVNLFRWDLSTGLLAATAGGFFRVLVRFANTPPSGIELQLHVKFPAGTPLTTLWDGPKMTATGNLLQDLGIVQLPPGIPSGSHDSVALVLSAEYTGTSQLDIDFLQLTPADSTRWWKQVGYQLDPNDLVVNDGPVNRVYALDAVTGYQWNIYQAYNGVLYVWPNRAQRLIFLHDEGSSMNIGRAWSVRAYYRPRRLTV